MNRESSERLTGWRRLFEPADIAALAVFRIMFGSLMFWEVCRYLTKGWIREYYSPRPFFFKFYGFGWVEPWPGNGMEWHFRVMGLLALGIVLGFHYRVCAALFFVAFTHVFLLEQANYLNHFYLISVVSFLMPFLPAHRDWSLDALRKPALRTSVIPRWAALLVPAQMGLVYFYAGVAKLNGDWLRGEPVRQWLAERSNLPLVGPMLTQEWFVYLIAYGGLLFDLLAPAFLVGRRTRPWFFAAALVFHLTNAQLFSIGVFPWFALTATLMFFPPDWPRRVWAAVRRHNPAAEISPTAAPSFHASAPVATLLGLFAAVQLLLPLRHWLYPGDVNWTEEGHTFSWRMKLRDKDGSTLFFVKDPATGRSKVVDPRLHLTARQVSKMAGRPDMIHQFALFLADYERRQGNPGVEVRVRALCRLNGRRPQALIDQDTDLAAQPRTLWTKPWILPLIEPLNRKQGGGRPAGTNRSADE